MQKNLNPVPPPYAFLAMVGKRKKWKNNKNSGQPSAQHRSDILVRHTHYECSWENIGLGCDGIWRHLDCKLSWARITDTSSTCDQILSQCHRKLQASLDCNLARCFLQLP